MASGFIDQLVDWRDFEEFVRDLYAKDPSLEVEHNVTQIGKSGAQRQIDVKFTHNAGGHTYVTLVECKRWKEKIDRRRIDELFASIEDLNAAKGVMFTTAGYEVGAETYAEHKGIDLFVVRDLTDEEWGPPGRVVWFYWHLYTAEISNVDPGRADPNRLPRLFANLPRFRRAEEDLAGFRRALNESRRSLANGGWPDFECEVVATVARHAAILGSYCIGKPA